MYRGSSDLPTPIKLKLWVGRGGGGGGVELGEVCQRLLIATHLEESNYLANQKQDAVNKYDLTVLIRAFQGSEKLCHFLGHIFSIGGDALNSHTTFW
jgi:hypothetical protein